MKEPIKKKRPGQSGSADSSEFVRQDRIEVRVNHHEKSALPSSALNAALRPQPSMCARKP